MSVERDASPMATNTTPFGSREGLREFLAAHGRQQPAEYAADGPQSASRVLSRAARRQKLAVTNVAGSHHVMTNGEHVIGGFDGHLTSLASDQADRASRSLPIVREYLQRAGLPTPAGRSFAPEDSQAGAAWFAALETPVVVKPGYSEAGAGITRDVHDLHTFSAAWDAAVERHSEAVGTDPSVVVEQQHPGFDLRMFIIGEETVAALARVPLFCIGDGRRTVRDLAIEAARRRDEHPQLGQHSYDVLDQAHHAGLTLDDCSEEGRPYLLGEEVVAHAGGVTVDVTALVCDALSALAIDALWAMPGCRAAGVDLLVKDLESAQDAVVLDVDARAGFTQHHFPWIGGRRGVADAIVRQMVATSKS